MILATISPAILGNYRSNGNRKYGAVRLIAAGATAGAVLVAMGGCSYGASHGAKAISPATRRAIKQVRLAADTSGHVSSLTASLAVRSVGRGGGDMSGTIAMQMKPAALIEARFVYPSAHGKDIHLSEILTNKAIYFKEPSFSQRKPWAKVEISQLSGNVGLTIGSLVQNLESSNPLDQTRMFTASKDVREVGTETVRGVPTTEYAGTYAPSAAYASLTPRLRQLIGLMLRAIGTHQVRFHVWIDAQHLIKMADYVVNVRGRTVTTTFVVTSVNQPVHVKLPKPSQTAPLLHM